MVPDMTICWFKKKLCTNGKYTILGIDSILEAEPSPPIIDIHLKIISINR